MSIIINYVTNMTLGTKIVWGIMIYFIVSIILYTIDQNRIYPQSEQSERSKDSQLDDINRVTPMVKKTKIGDKNIGIKIYFKEDVEFEKCLNLLLGKAETYGKMNDRWYPIYKSTFQIDDLTNEAVDDSCFTGIDNGFYLEYRAELAKPIGENEFENMKNITLNWQILRATLDFSSFPDDFELFYKTEIVSF